MANVVLVVDMLRGFLEEGYPLYCGTSARRIIPHVRRLIRRALQRNARPSSDAGGQATRLPARRQAEKAELVKDSEAGYDDDHVVTETFLFRRVRLRRQG